MSDSNDFTSNAGIAISSNIDVTTLEKEKAELEVKIEKLEKRSEWLKGELDCLRNSTMAYQSASSLSQSKQEKYNRHLDDKDSLKGEWVWNNIELGESHRRLKEINMLLAKKV